MRQSVKKCTFRLNPPRAFVYLCAFVCLRRGGVRIFAYMDVWVRIIFMFVRFFHEKSDPFRPNERDHIVSVSSFCIIPNLNNLEFLSAIYDANIRTHTHIHLCIVHYHRRLTNPIHCPFLANITKASYKLTTQTVNSNKWRNAETIFFRLDCMNSTYKREIRNCIFSLVCFVTNPFNCLLFFRLDWSWFSWIIISV